MSEEFFNRHLFGILWETYSLNQSTWKQKAFTVSEENEEKFLEHTSCFLKDGYNLISETSVGISTWLEKDGGDPKGGTIPLVFEWLWKYQLNGVPGIFWLTLGKNDKIK